MMLQKRRSARVLLVVVAALFVVAAAYIIFATPASFGPTISENDAIKAVENLPEVSQWMVLFNQAGGTSATTGGKPVVVVESAVDNSYFVHVYEDMSDHISTLGWYVVDMKTGEAFPYEDSPLFSKYGPCYGVPEGECAE